MAPKIQNPLLPPNSLILVTGANGFIASHIVDQLLQYNYRVRGTVRSLSRCTWMTPLFQQRYPSTPFELVEIPDITAPNCYDTALQGVSAVIHAAANTSLSGDPSVITDAINTTVNILNAVQDANKHGEAGSKIKRVVLTSSSWAACFPQPNKPMELTTETYDTYATDALADPKLPAEFRGVMTYTASKMRAEQESWKWFKQNPDCGFVLNTVLPSTCMGPVLAPNDQLYPSTAGYVRNLYEGKNAEFFDWLEPQWFVDVRDAARLHVAGAVLQRVEGERLFGFAEHYTWVGVKEVLEKEMAGKVPIQLKDRGEDMTSAPTERSVEVLGWLGVSGWVPFEESVRKTIRSFYPRT
jgi:nucleoside-diphosphate-sugar epimerase